MSESDHNWQFAGESNSPGEYYTKWACPCGAFKIEEMVVVQDDSGTHDTANYSHK